MSRTTNQRNRARRQRTEAQIRARSAAARSVVVYHGTALAHGPWIFQHGLQPSPPEKDNPTGAGPWVSPDRDTALMYAVRAVAAELDARGQLLDEKPEHAVGLIVTLRVPRDALIGDPFLTEYQLPGGCDPSAIVDFEPLDVGPGITVYPPEIRQALVRRDAATLGIGDDGRYDSFAAVGRPKPDDTLPDVLRLAVDHGVTNRPGRSQIHGERHWQAVAMTGLEIARQTPGADPMFVVTFAVLHDIMRRDDGHDPEHGSRAARLFEQLCLDGFPSDSQRSAEMRYALAHHNTGVQRATGRDVNVGICWDADRLNLCRLGITPDPSFLTTDVGREPKTLVYAEATSRVGVPDVQPWLRVTRLAKTLAGWT